MTKRVDRNEHFDVDGTLLWVEEIDVDEPARVSDMTVSISAIERDLAALTNRAAAMEHRLDAVERGGPKSPINDDVDAI